MKHSSLLFTLGCLVLGTAGGIATGKYLLPTLPPPASQSAAHRASSLAQETPTSPTAGGPNSTSAGGLSETGAAPTAWTALLAENNPIARTALEFDAVQKLDAKGLEDCLKATSALPQGQRQLELETMVLQKMARSDPAHAMELASAVPNAAAAHQLSSQVFLDWFAKSSDDAWKWASSQPDGIGRNFLLKEGLTAMAEKDAKSTAGYILQLAAQPDTEVLYDSAAVIAAQRLLKTDSDALNDFMAKLPEGRAKTDVVCKVAMTMEKTDPKTAAALLLSAEQSQETINSMTSVMDNWGRKNLPEALAFAQTLSGANMTGPMRFLLPQLAQTDLPGALALMQKLNNPEVTLSVIRNLPDTLKIDDPAKAATISNTLPDGPLKTQFLAGFAGHYAEKDPQGTAAWIGQLPDGDGKVRATQTAASMWAEKDPSSAQTWLKSLPAGPQRDAGIEAFLSSSGHGDPARDVSMAALIGDPKTRNFRLMYGYQNWAQKDPAAAQAWLATANLDPALVQTIQAQAQAQK